MGWSEAREAEALVVANPVRDDHTSDHSDQRVVYHGAQASLPPLVVLWKVRVVELDIGVVDHQLLLGNLTNGATLGIDTADNLVQVPAASDGMVGTLVALVVLVKVVGLSGQTGRECFPVLQGIPAHLFVVVVQEENSSLMCHDVHEANVFLAVLAKFWPVASDLGIVAQEAALDEAGNDDALDSLATGVDVLQGGVVVDLGALEILESSIQIDHWDAVCENSEGPTEIFVAEKERVIVPGDRCIEVRLLKGALHVSGGGW